VPLFVHGVGLAAKLEKVRLHAAAEKVRESTEETLIYYAFPDKHHLLRLADSQVAELTYRTRFGETQKHPASWIALASSLFSLEAT